MSETMSSLGLSLIDAETGAEIEGVVFPYIKATPRVGEAIHYWQDGTAERAGGDAVVRRDFIVRRVMHDLRYMPGHNGGRAMYVQTVVVYVTEVKPG